MAKSGKRRRRLSDGYSFEGFRPKATVRGVFGDPNVRVVSLERRSKKLSAVAAVGLTRAGTIDECGWFATYRAQDCGFFWSSRCDAFSAAVAVP